MFYSLSDIHQVRKYSLKEKVGYFVKGIFFYYLLMILSNILAICIDEIIIDYFKYPSLLETRTENTKQKISYGFLLVVIVVPIVEELIFRLVLLPTRRNILIFAVLFLLGFNAFMYQFEWLFWVSLIGSIILMLWGFNDMKNKIGAFLWKYQKAIIIISTIIFGFAHIGDVGEIHSEIFFLYPIFVLPQMLIGYFCSVLRLKLGFVWGGMFHSAINSIPTLLTIIS